MHFRTSVQNLWHHSLPFITVNPCVQIMKTKCISNEPLKWSLFGREVPKPSLPQLIDFQCKLVPLTSPVAPPKWSSSPCIWKMMHSVMGIRKRIYCKMNKRWRSLSFTWFCDISNRYLLLIGHVTKDSKYYKACQETGATVIEIYCNDKATFN